MELPKRILGFRSRIREEKLLIANSQSLLKHQSGKDLFRRATNLLSDVESFFLCNEILEQRRSMVAWAAWLRYTEMVFDLAVQERKAAQRNVERFGPTVMTIG